MGVGVGVSPDTFQKLGWVDDALEKIGKKRNISIFTRHYQAALILGGQENLIVTLPSKAAMQVQDNKSFSVLEPPFHIPKMQLKMLWSPLLQNDPGHKWMRQLIKSISDDNVE